MSTTLRTALALSRGWTALYTLGLSDVTRERRRGEIDSDLWEHRSTATLEGDREVDIGFDIFVRMLLGMPADLLWRLEASRSRVHRSRNGALRMLSKLFAVITSVVSGFAGVFFIYVAFGRTSNGAEGFAVPLLAAGLALLVGTVAAFWSVRLGSILVGTGAGLMVFMFPWMAGATLPIAIGLVLGTMARGRLHTPEIA